MKTSRTIRNTKLMARVIMSVATMVMCSNLLAMADDQDGSFISLTIGTQFPDVFANHMIHIPVGTNEKFLIMTRTKGEQGDENRNPWLWSFSGTWPNYSYQVNAFELIEDGTYSQNKQRIVAHITEDASDYISNSNEAKVRLKVYGGGMAYWTQTYMDEVRLGVRLPISGGETLTNTEERNVVAITSSVGAYHSSSGEVKVRIKVIGGGVWQQTWLDEVRLAIAP